MRGLLLVCGLGAGLVFAAMPCSGAAEAEGHTIAPKNHLDLSLPPLNPDGILVASHPKGATPEAQPPYQPQDSVVPAADKPSVDDDVDDTKLETDVDPHVEEDSAGALDDMGDVGGDFEE